MAATRRDGPAPTSPSSTWRCPSCSASIPISRRSGPSSFRASLRRPRLAPVARAHLRAQLDDEATRTAHHVAGGAVDLLGRLTQVGTRLLPHHLAPLPAVLAVEEVHESGAGRDETRPYCRRPDSVASVY